MGSIPDSSALNHSLKTWLSDDDCIAEAEEGKTYCIVEEEVEMQAELKKREAAAIKFLQRKNITLEKPINHKENKKRKIDDFDIKKWNRHPDL